MSNQGHFTRGIYEFNDSSGCMMAVRLPQSGSADLYDGTRVIVKPNQTAMLVYNGQITDSFGPGSHDIKTENVPLLTKLANWRFGFESPLKAEIWFFSGNIFTGRRWGTAQPVLINLASMGTVPVRAYGNCSIAIQNGKVFYLKLVGGRACFDISELDDFVQGQALELLPKALTLVTDPKDLNVKLDEISEKLERLLNQKLGEFGLRVVQAQVLSLLPSREILDALDQKQAMNIIGDQKEYLMYKMASAIGQSPQGQSADPTQLMMSLMLSKGLLGSDFHDKEKSPAALLQSKGSPKCISCGGILENASKFCANCGTKVEK